MNQVALQIILIVLTLISFFLLFTVNKLSKEIYFLNESVKHRYSFDQVVKKVESIMKQKTIENNMRIARELSNLRNKMYISIMNQSKDVRDLYHEAIKFEDHYDMYKHLKDQLKINTSDKWLNLIKKARERMDESNDKICELEEKIVKARE